MSGGKSWLSRNFELHSLIRLIRVFASSLRRRAAQWLPVGGVALEGVLQPRLRVNGGCRGLSVYRAGGVAPQQAGQSLRAAGHQSQPRGPLGHWAVEQRRLHHATVFTRTPTSAWLACGLRGGSLQAGALAAAHVVAAVSSVGR